MSCRRITAWIVLGLLALVQQAAATDSRRCPETGRLVLPPELCLSCGPLEEQLLDDLSDGSLDRHSILEAALIAGGADEVAVAASCTRVVHLAAAWRTTDAVAGDTQQRAERLFFLMHRELLTGDYHAEANDLALTIQHGSYNCLTATLLWQHLAQEFELPAVARQLPGHVQSMLAVGDAQMIIEPTCPRWFSQLDSTRPLASNEGRDLDAAALIAAVYYNRGLELLDQRQFPAALMAAYHAHRLDPAHAAARGNLLAILNNWALALAEQQQLPRAISLLEQGYALAPEHESFRVNLAALRRL
jgi:tetratricopeptide (TPR) repeat protein